MPEWTIWLACLTGSVWLLRSQDGQAFAPFPYSYHYLGLAVAMQSCALAVANVPRLDWVRSELLEQAASRPRSCPYTFVAWCGMMS